MNFEKAVKKKKINCVIYKAAKFNIDFNGYKRDILAYIMLQLLKPFFLGSRWFKDKNAFINQFKRSLCLRYLGLNVPLVHNSDSTGTKLPAPLRLTKISVPSFSALNNKIHKKKGKKGLETRVFTASLNDINKALKPKIKGDPAKLLPS